MMNSLWSSLSNYTKKDIIPMHMPGGKRCENLFYFSNPYLIDITEIDGFDNLHNAKGILNDEINRCADIYNADNALISVNGSSLGLLCAICGCVNEGDRVLVARNCHISIFNALIIRKVKPVYLYPEFDEYGIFNEISPDQVSCALNQYPDIKAVIIASPTYEGMVSDIKAISSICHLHHTALIVDEAHGAHFPFSKIFPETSSGIGADVVITSLHKTLPALTQTALILVNEGLVSFDKIKGFWDIFTTTSPSYVLMSSISACFDYLQSSDGIKRMKNYVNDLLLLRESLKNGLKNIILKDTGDISKLVFITSDGAELLKHLSYRYNIQLEMAGSKFALAMTSVADDKKAFERLRDAMYQSDVEFDKPVKYKIKRPHIPDMSVFPYEAFENDFVYIKINDLCGYVAAQTVLVYPPGIPVIVAGEIYDGKTVEYLNNAIKNNLEVTGTYRSLDGEVEVRCLK